MTGTVYLLHFDPPYPRDGRGGVRHYLGWTAGDVEERPLLLRKSTIVHITA